MHVILFEIVLQFCGFGACPKTRLARINLFLRQIFGEQAAKFSVKGSNGGMAKCEMQSEKMKYTTFVQLTFK